MIRARGLPLLLALLVAWLVGLSASVSAQQLSMRRYTVAQGLAHDMVTSIIQDSRGYIWAGTFEGVSRFDGYGFTSYDARDGLSTYVINDVIEDRQGRIWVATNGGGVARLNDEPEARGEGRFSSFLPGPGGAVNVNRLAIDIRGRLWCGTDAGVFVADLSAETPTFTLAGFSEGAATAVRVIGDRVWMGIRGVGLVEFGAESPRVHAVNWDPSARVFSIVPYGAGGLLVAAETGVFRYHDGRFDKAAIELLAGEIVIEILPDGERGYWLGTTRDLLHVSRTATVRYPVDRPVTKLAVDAGGNLWAAVSRAGLASLGPQQIFSYTQVHGLPEADVGSLVEVPGQMLAVSRSGVLSAIGAGPISRGPLSVGGFRRLTPGHEGWWGVTIEGVFHVRGDPTRPGPVFKLPLGVTPALTIPSANALIHLDPEGAIWFGTAERTLYRVRHPLSTERQVDRWPVVGPNGDVLAVLGIDRAGGVWLGHMATLARFFDGRLTIIDPPPGLAGLQPRAFFIDSRGAVWIGLRFGGVLVTDAPSSAAPTFKRYSISDGLASDAVMAIAEGPDGKIYLGTGRGLDQLDTSTGRVRHLSTNDGLAGNVINDVVADRSGRIWVAAVGGVSRLALGFAPAKPTSAPIYISRLQLAGVDHALPERGASMLRGLALDSSARHLRIEFVSPVLQHTGRIRYQYRLDGIDTDWSLPTPERNVTYGTLAAGEYKFHVRAVTADGRASDSPAVVEFVIHPPFYARGWFIVAVAAGMLAAAFAVEWTRRTRRRGLESIRRQLATDLHDDVGSGLAQIAILSEVVKRQADGTVAMQLGEVADLARSMRESMSDIVWAVDPSRDAPFALVHRMRQVTFNLLPSTTDVGFHAPGEQEVAGPDLPPDRRRQVLLIFKEAVTNIARHAGATRVTITLEIDRNRLLLRVEDNGAGFDVPSARDGHGLGSMASRAVAIGGELLIESRPLAGTRIVLSLPLRRRARMFRWLPAMPGRG